jgi:hypothetical protein
MSQKSLGLGGQGRPVRVEERRAARMRSDERKETSDQTEKPEEEKENVRGEGQSTGRGAFAGAGDRGGSGLGCNCQTGARDEWGGGENRVVLVVLR